MGDLVPVKKPVQMRQGSVRPVEPEPQDGRVEQEVLDQIFMLPQVHEEWRRLMQEALSQYIMRPSDYLHLTISMELS